MLAYRDPDDAPRSLAAPGSVPEQIQFCLILAGDDSIWPLVPVDHPHPIARSIENIIVDVDPAPIRRDARLTGIQHLPAAARHAVLRRMHGLASALVGVESNKEAHFLRAIPVGSGDIRGGCERRHDSIGKRRIVRADPVSDAARNGTKGVGEGPCFPQSIGSRHRQSPGQQDYRNSEPPRELHARSAPWLRLSRYFNILVHSSRVPKPATKISHPEIEW